MSTELGYSWFGDPRSPHRLLIEDTRPANACIGIGVTGIDAPGGTRVVDVTPHQARQIARELQRHANHIDPQTTPTEVEQLRAARIRDAAEADALIAQVQRLRAEAYRLRAENERLAAEVAELSQPWGHCVCSSCRQGPESRPATDAEPSASSAAQQWSRGDRVEWNHFADSWTPAVVVAALDSPRVLIQTDRTGRELTVDRRHLRVAGPAGTSLSQVDSAVRANAPAVARAGISVAAERPANVPARPITVADVRRDPSYYLAGPGRDQADGSEQCEEHGHPASSCTYCPTGSEEGNGDA